MAAVTALSCSASMCCSDCEGLKGGAPEGNLSGANTCLTASRMLGIPMPGGFLRSFSWQYRMTSCRRCSLKGVLPDAEALSASLWFSLQLILSCRLAWRPWPVLFLVEAPGWRREDEAACLGTRLAPELSIAECNASLSTSARWPLLAMLLDGAAELRFLMEGVDAMHGSCELLAAELAEDAFAGLLCEPAASLLAALLVAAAPDCCFSRLVSNVGRLLAAELDEATSAGLLCELAAFRLHTLLFDAAAAFCSRADKSGSLLAAELDEATSAGLLCGLPASRLPIPLPDCCLDSLVDRSGRLLAAELIEARSARLLCELPAFQSPADGPAVL